MMRAATRQATTSQNPSAPYNIVAADGTAYLAGTLNTGMPWTWQQIVTDLATTLGIGTLTLPPMPALPIRC